MNELITYEINYGADHKERFQVTAGSNAESLVKDYAEANGYEIREVERKGALILDLDPLEVNALQVAMDHFVEFIDDIVAQGEGDPDEVEGDEAKQAAVKSLHTKVMAATKEDAS